MSEQERRDALCDAETVRRFRDSLPSHYEFCCDLWIGEWQGERAIFMETDDLAAAVARIAGRAIGRAFPGLRGDQ